MSKKLNFITTLVLGVFCAVLLTIVGVFALTRTLPVWFSMYISTNVFCRIELSVDGGDFTPIFDNVNKNEVFPLTDSGLSLSGNELFLPIERLTSATLLSLKVYNYSTEKALTAEVVGATALSGVQNAVSVESSVMENLRPSAAGALLSEGTVPYDTLDFRVQSLFRNTEASVELKLTQTDNINNTVSTYKLSDNSTYTVGRYVDYYYANNITEGGIGPLSGFKDTDGTTDLRYKYYVQMGEYPQTIVTSTTDLAEGLFSIVSQTTNITDGSDDDVPTSQVVNFTNAVDLDNDGVADASGNITFTKIKEYTQTLGDESEFSAVDSNDNQYLEVGTYKIYWYSATVNDKTYKFVSTIECGYFGSSSTDIYSDGTIAYGGILDAGGIRRQWFFVEPINWIVIGGQRVDNATEVYGYENDFNYDTENGFYYGTYSLENKIEKLTLLAETCIDAVRWNALNANGNQWAGTCLVKDFLNSSTAGTDSFAVNSGLSSFFGNDIASTSLDTYYLNGTTYETSNTSSYLFLLGGAHNGTTYGSSSVVDGGEDYSFFKYFKHVNADALDDPDYDGRNDSTWDNSVTFRIFSTDYATAHHNAKYSIIGSDNNGVSFDVKIGNFTPITTSSPNSSYFWLRSGSDVSVNAYRSGYSGRVYETTITNNSPAVRPAFVLNV